jgi:two-component system, LytTR family, sensor histidine kinase AlgZ
LRHDLECHAGASDIRLHFQCHADAVLIVLSNPVRSALPPNPGLGLGLRNTRDRIALLYRGRASLDTRTSDGRFEVRLQLPPQIDT